MSGFQLANDRLLQVTLQNEKVMTKSGAMVAYDGNIKFDKALTGGEGILGVLKRTVTGESFNLMTASGTGKVYFAHKAREISIITLQGDKFFVESRCLLAFDQSLKTNTAFAGLRGATTGQGLFTTTIEGSGNLAVISHGSVLEFQVTPQYPLFVDPDAFIGYRGSISQEFVFDVNWKTFIGQTSGESFQLKFTGQGIVYIQPSETK
ncbi:MAG: AIM24 family protein [Candidatus Xenobiia bacterium LiM19]